MIVIKEKRIKLSEDHVLVQQWEENTSKPKCWTNGMVYEFNSKIIKSWVESSKDSGVHRG